MPPETVSAALVSRRVNRIVIFVVAEHLVYRTRTATITS
jgi:hypothetical protein